MACRDAVFLASGLRENPHDTSKASLALEVASHAQPWGVGGGCALCRNRSPSSLSLFTSSCLLGIVAMCGEERGFLVVPFDGLVRLCAII